MARPAGEEVPPAERPAVLWRARLRDDEGRVWRANALRAEDLWRNWGPAKPGPEVAALRSLRPVAIDVRVEAADGRAATRTVTRRLLAQDVKVRRWRDLKATLFLPAEPRATLVTAQDLAAPLLASRGAIVLLTGDASDVALERLAAVPGAGEPKIVSPPLPPGIPSVEEDHAARQAAWVEIVATIG